MTAARTSLPGAPIIEWAVCGYPLAGQTESGDLHVVVSRAEGTLVGVIDGLGHGAEAARAARTAANVLAQNTQEDLGRLLELCHEELRGTRGVVVSLAIFDAQLDTMSWTGVGNVEGMLFQASGSHEPRRTTLVSRNGVLGYRLPTFRQTTLPIARGDMAIFATDGIRSEFGSESPLGQSPDDVAAHIVKAHGSSKDDTLVLVVHYLGAPA